MAPVPAPIVHGHILTKRWFLLQTNFQVAANVAKVNGILDSAKAAGFNGAILSDGKFDRLDDGSLIDAYYPQLRAVLEHARSIDMTVLPATASFGYSASLLWHDPDLAEGLPVKDAPFRVAGGRLMPDAAADGVAIANGDFEALPGSGDTFPGWAFQDVPGTATFVDRAVKHGGRASLRMVDLGTTNAGSGNGRIHQRFAVEPYRYYHVSVWVKTDGFQGGDVRVLVLGQNPSRTLQWNSVPVNATQDWTRFDVTFNALTHHEVLFYLGVWGGNKGTIWWDDAAIEPAGFVNLIRRPGAPLRLTSPDGAIAYDEGRDVEAVRDPATGRVPYNGVYDLWHAPPSVAIPAGSRLHEGDVVRASYYHMATVYGDQVTASLTEPKVFDLVDGMLRSTRREFAAADAFGGWMLSHDEIRVGGWDEAPMAGGGSPGEALAFNVRTVVDHARALDIDAPLYVWSDMFDPFHNAADTPDPYYLVNGNWSGSWEGLDPAVTVINWNHGAKAHESASFFAGRGNHQLLAGYYDTPPNRFNDRQWLADLADVPGIDGVLYCQWGSGFDNLAAWAQHVWGGAEWVTPPAAPSATAAAVPSVSATSTLPTSTATSTPAATDPPRSATATASPSGPTTPVPSGGRVWLPWGHRGP
ncbi:MAG: carbohydrate binding domain-containing protein [Ardenticatenales bacterium]